FWWVLAQPTNQRSEPIHVTVSPESLERHVRVLSEDFIPRNWKHLGNLHRTGNYLTAEFEKIGVGTVADQWFQTANGSRYRNVSLLIGDATKPRIIVGAHYDAYSIYPGADDNASGVAGLIELARLVAASPIESPVEFVAYPLEEPPHFGTREMGSWQHADATKRAGVECKYMISLEMIGYFTDEKGSQDYPLPLLKAIYPSTGDFIAVAGNFDHRDLIQEFKIGMRCCENLPIVSISAPRQLPGIDFSDHRNYWMAGFPAIMITDTAFYRNKNYHTVEDTAEKLDFDKMASVVAATFNAMQRLESLAP
ncbi:MAG: M28 family peptidase, partial [Verrucomicrobiota bacterium]